MASDELADYSKIFKTNGTVNSITFERLRKTKLNSLVLVEDIIHLSTSEEKNLRLSLNYDAHHKRQKIFCVTHSIYKTSVWSLLPFFHYIIFTSSASNLPVIRACLKIFFKVENSIILNWLHQFKELGKEQKDAYFYFDCGTVKFYFSKNLFDSAASRLLSDTTNVSSAAPSSQRTGEPDNEENLELKKKLLESKFEKFCETHPSKSQATAIFSILINCIDLNLIREHDLTIAFQSKKRTTANMRISLVDYISLLLDSEQKKPNTDFLVLHNYLSKFCTIPSMFILNAYF